jgi:hypothetical protein
MTQEQQLLLEVLEQYACTEEYYIFYDQGLSVLEDICLYLFQAGILEQMSNNTFKLKNL